MWVTGQLLKAKRELDLMQSDLFTGHGLFPELAFFDCHACHHPMNDVRWSPTRVTKRLPIGVVRLDEQLGGADRGDFGRRPGEVD